jgi:predicted DCC family thiol-disulfide oxidoreductase YuxK
VEVFRQTYDILGIGWIYSITKIPIFGSLADILYGVWADYRLLLTGRGNLKTIVAKRQKHQNERENNLNNSQGRCADGCEIEDRR